jgi:GntR family transcriptional regulator/MocR family aminotransferase
MEKTWANSGIDLHLDVAGTRVRSGLENALRDAVRSGRLRPQTRLPPSRALAADLGIARNTVADAYSQLTAEGWLTARTGSGTWVAGHPAPAGPPPRPDRPAGREPRYDLRPGAGDLAAFPRRAWLAAARKAVAAAPPHVFGYPDPRGLPALRDALAGYLARARGVTADPGRILVCAGFTQGLALLSQVLAARGARAIAVEAYGHAAHRRLPEARGLLPVPLPVDAAGAVTGSLPGLTASAGVTACLLTPAHQFPLGVTLHPERRRAAVSWAVATGGLVIEDDYDGEFRYDRQPVGAMQALAPGQVAYAGTASKSLAPGLRLGWLVLPGWLMDDMVAAKEAAGAAGSALDELTLAEFITSGGYDRQIRLARLVYRRRRDRLVAALRQHAPQVRVTGIAAGLHALAELPPGTDEEQVTARAAARGLSVDGLASYRAAADGRGPALVAGYGRPPAHAFTTALARLCAVLAEPG